MHPSGALLLTSQITLARLVVNFTGLVCREFKEMLKTDGESLLFAVDLAGTLLFAIEGATAATNGQLDLLGVMVLAFATALVAASRAMS